MNNRNYKRIKFDFKLLIIMILIIILLLLIKNLSFNYNILIKKVNNQERHINYLEENLSTLYESNIELSKQVNLTNIELQKQIIINEGIKEEIKSKENTIVITEKESVPKFKNSISDVPLAPVTIVGTLHVLKQILFYRIPAY